MNVREMYFLSKIWLKTATKIKLDPDEFIVLANTVYNDYATIIRNNYKNYFLSSQSYSTTANTATYDLPTDNLQIVKIERTDVSPAVPLPFIPFNNKDRYISSTGGTPGYWTFDETTSANVEKIRLMDTPNTATTNFFKIYYIRKQKTLTRMTDEPDMPVNYHDLIPRKVVYIMWSSNGINVLDWARNLEKSENEMIKSLMYRQVQNPPRILANTNYEDE